MDLLNTSFIEGRASIVGLRKLFCSTIIGSTVLVWRIMWFLRSGMAIFLSDINDVAIHSGTTCSLFVVQFEINTGIFISLPIFSDIVVLLEDRGQVISIFLSNIFHNKVVYG